MLPWKKASGREAYRLLTVYDRVPVDLKDKEFVKIENADGARLGTHKIVTVSELSHYLRGE